MIVSVNPLSGQPMLLPRQKAAGGGGGGGGGGRLLATIAGSLPDSGLEGQLLYNTTDATLYVYVNGVWTAISGSSDAATFDFIDGTDFLFVDETGFDFII